MTWHTRSASQNHRSPRLGSQPHLKAQHASPENTGGPPWKRKNHLNQQHHFQGFYVTIFGSMWILEKSCRIRCHISAFGLLLEIFDLFWLGWFNTYFPIRATRNMRSKHCLFCCLPWHQQIIGIQHVTSLRVEFSTHDDLVQFYTSPFTHDPKILSEKLPHLLVLRPSTTMNSAFFQDTGCF